MEDKRLQETKFNVVINGAGEESCGLLLDLLDEPGVDIIGISDSDTEAPGLEIARRHDIPILSDPVEFFQNDPDVVIDMAGIGEAAAGILKNKPRRTEIIGKNSIKIFMELINKCRRSEEDTKNHLTTINELYNLGISLTAANTLENALNIILKEALRSIDAPAGSIALYDDKSKSLTLKALEGFTEGFSTATHWKMREGGMTENILVQEVPTVINDIKDHHYIDNKILLEAGIKSLVAVPFRADTKIVGILYIDDFEPRLWTPREIEFLILLSTQAAFTIEKFKLIEGITDTKTYLKNVLDNSADMIITTDTERRIVEFNKGASRILGYTMEEMVGKQVEFLWIKPEERSEILDLIDKSGYVSNYETQFKTKNDDIIDLSLTLSYISDSNGKILGTVGISKDITEKKRLEKAVAERNRELQELNETLEEAVVKRTRELQEANNELKRSSELKSRFIATMSHELRTPLNSILGFSELIMEDSVGLSPEKRKGYAANIHNSGKHLLQLINNILDLAKIESGKLELNYESFPLQWVIAEVESVIKPLSDKKNQKMEIMIADELSLISADRIKFKQILYNLLSNAVKFTSNGGAIILAAELISNPVFKTGVAGSNIRPQSNDFLRLSVADTGIGIKNEDRDRIFAEFEQVDSSYARQFEGTGLGLALTKKMVELHGGEIRVESKEGAGSTFIIEMPIKDMAAKTAGSEHVTMTYPSPPYVSDNFRDRKEGGSLILVVEDDRATSELITLYLVQGGYRVAHVYNGDEAIGRVRELKPFAIILDIMLPGKDGWEILQNIKSDPELMEIPVIISSIIDNNALGFALGASDYLVKPVDKNTLIDKLNGLSLAAKKKRKPVNILCIDDNVKALEFLTAILEPAGYSVITSNSGREGIDKAVIYRPDLIILDLMMPDVDGFEVTGVLKENPATMNIPIFVLTAKDITMEERLKLVGKTESFMQKNFFTKEDLLMHIRDLEIIYPVRAGMLDEDSGLFDHSYFQLRLAQEISRAERYRHPFSVIMVDLDNFTEYIRANGQRRANICIRKIADFIMKSLRGSDVIGRYGVDEFAIILSNTVKESTQSVAKRILSFIDTYPFYGEDMMPGGKLTASISIINYFREAFTAEEIIAKAHELLRKAKENGGGNIQIYEHKE